MPRRIYTWTPPLRARCHERGSLTARSTLPACRRRGARGLSGRAKGSSTCRASPRTASGAVHFS
eukprot:7495165-Pyramimonas_sp.AAC.2